MVAVIVVVVVVVAVVEIVVVVVVFVIVIAVVDVAVVVVAVVIVVVVQVNLDMTDSMGPGKLVCHIQNPSYTYDEYLICIGLGQAYCPSYAEIRRSVVRHIQVHLWLLLLFL